MKKLFDGFEKLINEHGSAAILKERISLANDQYSFLEKQKISLESDNENLKDENRALKLNLEEAKEKIKEFEEQISSIHNTNPDGYVCDHCASPSLTRTGSRPDPTFGDLGIKQKIFSCNVCGKESAFTPESNNKKRRY